MSVTSKVQSHFSSFQIQLKPLDMKVHQKLHFYLTAWRINDSVDIFIQVNESVDSLLKIPQRIVLSNDKKPQL